MKLINCCSYFFTYLLIIFITGCNKDNSVIEDNTIPATIKKDFYARYPSAEISSFQNYSDGIDQIKFSDPEQNEALVSYVNENWKMTYTEIKDIQQLPFEVLSSFVKSGYGDAQNIEIFKTERDGMTKALYTFHFTYRWKKVDDIEHYTFISEDGLYLTTVTWKPNDTRFFINLPKAHFDFISNKYNGAEVRAYINYGGYYEYLILHNDTIKCVTFRGEDPADKESWRETRYELSKDTKIPENVIQVLKQDDPDFVYTHVYYIESNEGNMYFLQDKNRDNELGYTINENGQPAKD